jgi:hypothetical protein
MEISTLIKLNDNKVDIFLYNMDLGTNQYRNSYILGD